MTRPRFLRALGIAGGDALEPAILAALATESLLLLGPKCPWPVGQARSDSSAVA